MVSYPQRVGSFTIVCCCHEGAEGSPLLTSTNDKLSLKSQTQRPAQFQGVPRSILQMTMMQAET
jgi:hypothetical protein